uniref:Phosphatidylserine decarboxylase proenzyme 2 n=1 Tax=Rhizophora mucronata TaxID=61149 RepID=A0A2P2M6N7_RHIMU
MWEALAPKFRPTSYEAKWAHSLSLNIHPYEACLSVRNPPVITWFPVPSSKHRVKCTTVLSLSDNSRLSPQTGQQFIRGSFSC